MKLGLGVDIETNLELAICLKQCFNIYDYEIQKNIIGYVIEKHS